MNLSLDLVIRRFVRDAEFRSCVKDADQSAAESAGVGVAELAAVARGDLVRLYRWGAHPLLVMQLAGALGIDPMLSFGADQPTQDDSSANHEQPDHDLTTGER